jgi:hypothetical protein
VILGLITSPRSSLRALLCILAKKLSVDSTPIRAFLKRLAGFFLEILANFCFKGFFGLLIGFQTPRILRFLDFFCASIIEGMTMDLSSPRKLSMSRPSARSLRPEEITLTTAHVSGTTITGIVTRWGDHSE